MAEPVGRPLRTPLGAMTGQVLGWGGEWGETEARASIHGVRRRILGFPTGRSRKSSREDRRPEGSCSRTSPWNAPWP